MKNAVKIIGVGCLIILSVIAIILNNNIEKIEETKEKNEFKEEYEAFNDKINEKNDKTYLKLEIAENNPFVYADYDQLFEVLEGTGVIYLGYPECPWCRNLVPVLIDASKKVSLGRIYYMNMKEERNVLKQTEDGIITEKEGTEGYQKLVEKLEEVLPTYEGLDDESIKRIYVPMVIFVRDGKIVATHTGTLDSQEDPYQALTEEQVSELKDILVDAMLEISDSSCESTC